MSSERIQRRIQRRIERLLDLAKAAAEQSDWEESRRLTDDGSTIPGSPHRNWSQRLRNIRAIATYLGRCPVINHPTSLRRSLAPNSYLISLQNPQPKIPMENAV